MEGNGRWFVSEGTMEKLVKYVEVNGHIPLSRTARIDSTDPRRQEKV